MTKMVLPLDTKPLMRCFLHEAFILSILKTDQSRTEPWIYSNYIQTVYRQANDAHYDIFASWEMLNNVFRWKQFTHDVIDDCSGSFVDFAKGAIKREYYIYCFADQFYIPHRPFFGKQHMIHDELIFGFDDENKTFDIIAFTDTGDYRPTTLTYEQLEKSAPPYIGYLQINRDTPMRLDPLLIWATIRDYLEPSRIKNRYNMWRDVDPDDVYGIEASAMLTDIFKDQRDGSIPLDIRPPHLLFEHKELMLKRIDYLLSKGVMSDKTLLTEFGAITEKAATLRRIYLRSFIGGDTQKLDKAVTLNEGIIKDEKRVLARVADDIEKTCVMSERRQE